MITRMRGLVGLMTILLLLAGCGSGGVYTSENWQVTINGAEYQKDYEYNAYPPPTYSAVKRTREGFVIQTTIRYIGQGDSAPAPEVYIKRVDNDQIIKPNYSKAENIFIDDQGKEGKRVTKIGKDPKTGKMHVARVDYLFTVANDNTEFLLFIGDLKPIKVKP